MSKSEIAYLRTQMELACEAARRGLNDFAIATNHEAINARMARLGEQLQDYQCQLASLVGEHQASRIVAETYLEIVG
jgi:hypothetical protein